MTIAIRNVYENFLKLIKGMINLMPQKNYALDEDIESYTVKKTSRTARTKEQIIQDLNRDIELINKGELKTYSFDEIKYL